ncbi:hypothetical protein [Fictibacillus gelatini]|uniref:hypothetical protein n=1 Tax=Fictibacillus gelatini TaxID=225985 RepID=UPI00047CA976|nr:hypothetical protein [Fictibacillus gelatini]
MDFSTATRAQLVHIINHESLDDKYAAARELHLRKHADCKMNDPRIWNLSRYIKQQNKGCSHDVL